jgi:hypothetical protein
MHKYIEKRRALENENLFSIFMTILSVLRGKSKQSLGKYNVMASTLRSCFSKSCLLIKVHCFLGSMDNPLDLRDVPFHFWNRNESVR